MRMRVECANGVVVDVDQAFATYGVIRRQCMKLVRARERHVAGQSRARDAKVFKSVAPVPKNFSRANQCPTDTAVTTPRARRRPRAGRRAWR